MVDFRRMADLRPQSPMRPPVSQERWVTTCRAFGSHGYAYDAQKCNQPHKTTMPHDEVPYR
jgi:hypothetical protein